MGTVFTILACICLGISIYFTMKELKEGSKIDKISGCLTSLILIILIVMIQFAIKENIKYQTMNDYFDGKIEVIQQIDTTRTFKFN